MNAMERRQYEMLVRVRDFGGTYGHLFPISTVAGENFAAVDAAIRELDAQDLRHMAASVSSRAQRKDAARQALLTRLQAISQTARVLPEDEAGVVRQFVVPTPATDQTLLTTGRKFVQDAEAFGSQFIAHGMPVTFLTDLNVLVEGFEAALRDRGLGREARRAARASTEAAVSSGIAAVRSVNAIVTNHLADDPVTTSVWNRERRIVYPKRTGVTPAPASGPAPLVPESDGGTKAA
jgi:hypothetical protein